MKLLRNQLPFARRSPEKSGSAQCGRGTGSHGIARHRCRLIANQYDQGSNRVSEIFPPPFPVDGDVLFVFDGNGYITPSWDTDANAWNFDPVLPPGRGCRYVRYPPTASLTF